jgi:DNA-directed RNA polymerase specialized sigma24 family protein
MFRRRAREPVSLDRAALEANCRTVIAELAQDFDWRLADPEHLARRVSARAHILLAADLETAADPAALRRTLEREASAEYFADLYDDLGRGGQARAAALTELFRPEEIEDAGGPRAVYRGYLFRAAVFYLMRWTGRAGWSPPPEQVEDLARAAAEDVQMTLLRNIELREGRRAFWSFLSRAVERRAIDKLRALSRRESAASLEEITERLGREPEGVLAPATELGTFDAVALSGDLARMMEAARLSGEERFALVAGAYGFNDTEAAAELARRTGRSIGPPDIRRWRFRGRDKLRRSAEIDR